jgi:P-type Ca2+ transporter type 2C
MPEAEVRALSFFSLVVTIVGLIFVNRSFSASLREGLGRPNPALAFVIAAVVAVLTLSLAWPFAQGLFRFGPLHVDDLALAVASGGILLVALEGVKPYWGRKRALA